jgi:GH15 family glucan-1,4-alpha-glucosidase
MNNVNPSIADHVLIGNCRTAAMVSKFGYIDWCCIPEFHSPSIFAALLDNEKGGYFMIQPVKEFRSIQSYLPNTNVAELIFENEEGTVRLTDCFVAMEENEKQTELFPDHEILRIAEGLQGSMKLRFEYVPRSFYGKFAVKLKDYKKLGIHFSYKENICVFQTSAATATVSDDKEKVVGEFYLNKGERVIFSISCSTQYPAIIPEIKVTAITRLENTIRLPEDPGGVRSFREIGALLYRLALHWHIEASHYNLLIVQPSTLCRDFTTPCCVNCCMITAK